MERKASEYLGCKMMREFRGERYNRAHMVVGYEDIYAVLTMLWETSKCKLI